jgi:hypothetical protein
MNFTLLSNHEMYGLAKGFASAKPLVDRVQTAWIGPEFAKLVNDFMPFDVPTDLQEDLQQLMRAALAFNDTFDGTTRVTLSIFDAYIELAERRGDQALVQHLVGLRARVLPDGATHTQRTYYEQAQFADQLAKGLEEHPDMKAALKAQPIPGGTLLDLVEEIVQSGLRLGDVEAKRQALQDASTLAKSAPKPVPISQVRSNWIRLTRTMLANLNHATPLSQEEDLSLLGPLRRLTERAATRKTPPNPDSPATQPDPTAEGDVVEEPGS